MVKELNGEQNSTLVRKRSPEYVKEKMIDDIISNFDFESCRYAMLALGWSWSRIRRTPSIEELKDSAKKRIEAAISGVLNNKDRLTSNDYYFSSSGGLKATAWRNRYGHLSAINLEFVVTEWDSDGDYIDENED